VRLTKTPSIALIPFSYAIKFLITKFRNKLKQQQETKNLNGCNSGRVLFLFCRHFSIKLTFCTTVIRQSIPKAINIKATIKRRTDLTGIDLSVYEQVFLPSCLVGVTGHYLITMFFNIE